jgi:hypothetical protein
MSIINLKSRYIVHEDNHYQPNPTQLVSIFYSKFLLLSSKHFAQPKLMYESETKESENTAPDSFAYSLSLLMLVIIRRRYFYIYPGALVIEIVSNETQPIVNLKSINVLYLWLITLAPMRSSKSGNPGRKL